MPSAGPGTCQLRLWNLSGTAARTPVPHAPGSMIMVVSTNSLKLVKVLAKSDELISIEVHWVICNLQESGL